LNNDTLTKILESSTDYADMASEILKKFSKTEQTCILMESHINEHESLFEKFFEKQNSKIKIDTQEIQHVGIVTDDSSDSETSSDSSSSTDTMYSIFGTSPESSDQEEHLTKNFQKLSTETQNNKNEEQSEDEEDPNKAVKEDTKDKNYITKEDTDSGDEDTKPKKEDDGIDQKNIIKDHDKREQQKKEAKKPEEASVLVDPDVTTSKIYKVDENGVIVTEATTPKKASAATPNNNAPTNAEKETTKTPTKNPDNTIKPASPSSSPPAVPNHCSQNTIEILCVEAIQENNYSSMSLISVEVWIKRHYPYYKDHEVIINEVLNDIATNPINKGIVSSIVSASGDAISKLL
jgi:hypothetical protein